MSKILIATEKPFSKQAVAEVKQVFESSGDEVRLLEKYSEKSELIDAVSDVDALIIRSDKITREVMDAAPELKIVRALSFEGHYYLHIIVYPFAILNRS